MSDANEISPYEWMAREFERLAILRKMWTANEVAATLRRYDIERASLSPPAQPSAPPREVGAKTEAVITRDGFFINVEWWRFGKHLTARVYEPLDMRLTPALADVLALALEDRPTLSPPAQPSAPDTFDFSKEYQTRDGQPVTGLRRCRIHPQYPIEGWIGTSPKSRGWTEKGKCYGSVGHKIYDDPLDLVAVEKAFTVEMELQQEAQMSDAMSDDVDIVVRLRLWGDQDPTQTAAANEIERLRLALAAAGQDYDAGMREGMERAAKIADVYARKAQDNHLAKEADAICIVAFAILREAAPTTGGDNG